MHVHLSVTLAGFLTAEHGEAQVLRAQEEVFDVQLLGGGFISHETVVCALAQSESRSNEVVTLLSIYHCEFKSYQACTNCCIYMDFVLIISFILTLVVDSDSQVKLLLCNIKNSRI